MTEKYHDIKQLGLSCGFSHIGDLNADTIVSLKVSNVIKTS